MQRRVWFGFFTISLLLFTSVPSGAQCDRNGDQRVTASDALLVLQDSVAQHCVGYTPCPDMNDDNAITASDALLMLRQALDLDPPAECVCYAYDECFSNADCESYGYDPPRYCAGYYCVECEFDNQCPSRSCDGCMGVCRGSDTTLPVTTSTIPTTTVTTTTVPIECSTDSDCVADPQASHCCAERCSECSVDSDCPSSLHCDATCTCVINAEQTMYWTEWGGGVLRRSRADGSSVETIAGLPQPRGIALDPVAGYYYAISGIAPGIGTIVRGPLSGGGTPAVLYAVVGGGSPNYLAFDADAQKFYWSEFGWNSKIGQAKLGLPFTGTFSDVGVGEDLVVVPGGPIYWADSAEASGGLFRKATMAAAPEAIKSGIRPVGIAVGSDGAIYWTDPGGHRIVRTDPGTLSDLTVVSNLGLPTDIALDEAEAKLYWVDFRRGVIKRSDLDGANVRTLASGLDRPLAVALHLASPR